MNQVWRLARRPPKGWPGEGDFVHSEEPLPEPADGQALTRTIYLSMDPYQWGRRRSGVEAAGDVCHGRTVSVVVESRTARQAPSDYVFNMNSRISLCGMISQYGNTDGRDAHEVWAETGRAVFSRQNVSVHRLMVRNYVAEYQDRFLREMADWISDGKVKYREDIWEGIDQAPAAFSAMLAGGNFGKTLVRVSEDPTLPGTANGTAETFSRQRRDVLT